MNTYTVRVSRSEHDPDMWDYNIMTSFDVKAPNRHDAQSYALKLYQKQFPNNIEKYDWNTYVLAVK